MAADIEYLLTLGLTIEDIAERAGRTPTAIQHELDAHRQALAEEARVQSGSNVSYPVECEAD